MEMWLTHELTRRIEEILRNVQSEDPQHHFGQPYITAYQIAIELERQHPNLVTQIGKPIGGQDVGQHDSLAQYISNQLSRRIKSGEIITIEGAFLHQINLLALEYKHNCSAVKSSSMPELALYRIRNSE